MPCADGADALALGAGGGDDGDEFGKVFGVGLAEGDADFFVEPVGPLVWGGLGGVEGEGSVCESDACRQGVLSRGDECVCIDLGGFIDEIWWISALGSA